jgi:RecA-family ATPase
MIAGYGSSGKTLAAQSAALSVAAGRSVWPASVDAHHENGGFTLTPGEHGKARRVLHLDYEMGRNATLRRYAKLARGLALTPEDIGGRLDVVCLPQVFLNDPDRPAIEAFFATECAARPGEDPPLVIVDAFRGTIPGEDENDSNVRCFLDIFLRVSSTTGSTFLVLHHAGKGDRADARMILRGSSAIFDACGSVLGVAPVDPAEFAGPKRVVHLKNPEGRATEDFGLAIVDAGRGSLLVQHRTREQITPVVAEAPKAKRPLP